MLNRDSDVPSLEMQQLEYDHQVRVALETLLIFKVL